MYAIFRPSRKARKSAQTASSTLKSRPMNRSPSASPFERLPVPAIWAPPAPSAASNFFAKFRIAWRPIRVETNFVGVSGSTQ